MIDEIEYFGIVKWFGDKKNSVQYGFIYNEQLGDVFIHKKNLTSEIKANDIVQFKIVHSKNKEGKYEATDVKGISDKEELEKRIEIFLGWELSDDCRHDIHNSIYKLSNNTELLIVLPWKRILEKFITEGVQKFLTDKHYFSLLQYYEKIKSIFDIDSFSKSYFKKKTIPPNLIEFFNSSANEYVSFLGCLEGHVSLCRGEFIKHIYKELDIDYRRRIVSFVGVEALPELINISIDDFTETPPMPAKNYSVRYEFLSNMKYDIASFTREVEKRDKELCKKYLREIYPKCSRNLKLDLWLQKEYLEFTYDLCDLIIEQISKFDDTYTNPLLNRLLSMKNDEFEFFIDKLTASEISQSYGNIYRVLLQRIKNRPKYLNRLVETLPTTSRLELWCNDELEKLDLILIAEAFPSVNENYQILTIKKIFNHYGAKSKDRITQFLEEVINKLSISKCSFELFIVVNILLRKIKSQNLDFSEFLILISKSLAINDKFDIQNVEDFFGNKSCRDLLEYCSGRTSEKNNIISKSSYIPAGTLFCEGRKSPNLSQKSDLEFYWCKNIPCFRNEIDKEKLTSWQNAKLFNLIRKIDNGYEEDDHSYLLGVLNKMFRYIPHLKCKECNSWLVPIRQSNYAYDRINNFVCINDNCVNKNVEIYLTHCLNSRCSNVVDSRNTIKCNHSWYICDYCLCCCSTKKLKTKKDIVLQTGQNYAGSEKGHDELNQIFCPKCGNEIHYTEVQKESPITIYTAKMLKCSNNKCEFEIELDGSINERLWALRHHQQINNLYRD